MLNDYNTYTLRFIIAWQNTLNVETNAIFFVCVWQFVFGHILINKFPEYASDSSSLFYDFSPVFNKSSWAVDACDLPGGGPIWPQALFAPPGAFAPQPAPVSVPAQVRHEPVKADLEDGLWLMLFVGAAMCAQVFSFLFEWTIGYDGKLLFYIIFVWLESCEMIADWLFSLVPVV